MIFKYDSHSQELTIISTEHGDPITLIVKVEGTRHVTVHATGAKQVSARDLGDRMFTRYQ